ncbi:MAG TPA: hypothetical protein VL020_02990, partial [Pseudomonadales bacterium]|nr:hypothetical protein [Pseudomonadales bacterium]
MGLLNILRVCSALFLTAALGSAQANYIYDNATGSWKPTSRTVLAPPGAGSPFNYIPRDSPPTVTSTGGFQNKTGGTFGSPPVNGTSRNVPVTINGTTTKPNVNRALLSRLGKGGLAGIALGAGINALLNGIGALIDDGGNVALKGPPVVPLLDDCEGCSVHLSRRHGGSSYANCGVAISHLNEICVTGDPTGGNYCGLDWGDGGHFVGYQPVSTYSARCFYSSTMPPLDPSIVPLPADALEDAINSGYNPDPSDYPFLAPDPAMQPTIVEVEPIPRLSIPPITTTTIDLDTGKTTIVETNVWQDFNVKDNNSDQ